MIVLLRIDKFARPGPQLPRILGVHDQAGNDQIAKQVIKRPPRLAAVVTPPNATTHRAGPHRLGLLGVNDDRPRPATDVVWPQPFPHIFAHASRKWPARSFLLADGNSRGGYAVRSILKL